jgi:hypothetical protein
MNLKQYIFEDCPTPESPYQQLNQMITSTAKSLPQTDYGKFELYCYGFNKKANVHKFDIRTSLNDKEGKNPSAVVLVGIKQEQDKTYTVSAMGYTVLGAAGNHAQGKQVQKITKNKIQSSDLDSSIHELTFKTANELITLLPKTGLIQKTVNAVKNFMKK